MRRQQQKPIQHQTRPRDRLTIFGFFYPDDTLVGQDFLVIADGDPFPYPLQTRFATYERLGVIASKRRGETVRTFSVWRADNYSGKG